MDPAHSPDDDNGSTLEYIDDPVTEVSELSTPVTFSADASPNLSELPLPADSATATQKKKKKKKSKKSAKAKEAAAAALKTKTQEEEADSEDRPQVLCISRNKHWRYISSYHGPWLQLPVELLESLLLLNLDPAVYTTAVPPTSHSLPTSPISPSGRFRSFPNLEDYSPPESPRNAITTLPVPSTSYLAGKAAPPPIDPGVLRSVTSIRRLIDEAAELSVRASSGLSGSELGTGRTGSSYNGSSWAAAQSLGLNPLGTNGGGGRSVNMSANRVHRLRALAVQKLAQAYKTDEIASSVMVMQGGSVFDDVAERVLKSDPNDADAKYVHFFHEKIPSSHRQLAESTTTVVLDELIAAFPHRLEYYRTRGIVHCFRDEFAQATKDFTYALKEARAQRKAKMAHHNNASPSESRNSKGKKRKGGGSTHAHTNGQAPPEGTSIPDGMAEGPDGEPVPLHPSILPDAPEPIETQLLFLRGAAYLQHVIYLIENAVLELEGVQKQPSVDGAELRLCYLENGRYGGVEVGNLDGPLGNRNGPKLKAYRQVLAAKPFKDHIVALLKKSIRDHERFLSHFNGGETLVVLPRGDIAAQVEYAFLLSESVRPGNHNNPPPPNVTEAPPALTTYHPLLVESHFSVLICYLLLAEFSSLLPLFAKTVSLVDGVEGYPIFLPPRSMGQAEFIEVLERLAAGWRNGIQPHSLTTQRGKSRLAIEPPALITPSNSTSSTSSTVTAPSSALLANAIAGIGFDAFPPSPSSSAHGGTGATLTSPTATTTNTTDTIVESKSSSSSCPTSLRPDNIPGYCVPSTSSASVSRKSSHNALHNASSIHGDEDVDNNHNNSSSSSTTGTAVMADSSKDGGKEAEASQEFYRPDASEALDCARILLAPVVKRQRERTEQAVADRVAGIKKKSLPINIPLHGPRVEVILAWVGAVHLPELDGV